MVEYIWFQVLYDEYAPETYSETMIQDDGSSVNHEDVDIMAT